jgi:hypothetical protein
MADESRRRRSTALVGRLPSLVARPAHELLLDEVSATKATVDARVDANAGGCDQPRQRNPRAEQKRAEALLRTQTVDPSLP